MYMDVDVAHTEAQPVKVATVTIICSCNKIKF